MSYANGGDGRNAICSDNSQMHLGRTSGIIMRLTHLPNLTTVERINSLFQHSRLERIQDVPFSFIASDLFELLSLRYCHAFLNNTFVISISLGFSLNNAITCGI